MSHANVTNHLIGSHIHSSPRVLTAKQSGMSRSYVGIGVSYRLAAMWLDDLELMEVARELAIVLQPPLANTQKPGRKRRILGTVLLPSPDADVS